MNGCWWNNLRHISACRQDRSAIPEAIPAYSWSRNLMIHILGARVTVSVSTSRSWDGLETYPTCRLVSSRLRRIFQCIRLVSVLATEVLLLLQIPTAMKLKNIKLYQGYSSIYHQHPSRHPNTDGDMHEDRNTSSLVSLYMNDFFVDYGNEYRSLISRSYRRFALSSYSSQQG